MSGMEDRGSVRIRSIRAGSLLQFLRTARKHVECEVTQRAYPARPCRFDPGVRPDL